MCSVSVVKCIVLYCVIKNACDLLSSNRISVKICKYKSVCATLYSIDMPATTAGSDSIAIADTVSDLATATPRSTCKDLIIAGRFATVEMKEVGSTLFTLTL